MSKKQENIEQENKNAAEELNQAAGEYLKRHEGEGFAAPKMTDDGVIVDPPSPANDPQSEPEAVAAPEAPAPIGIPTAEEIRMSHKPEPEAPLETWLDQTRNQLGAFLRDNQQLLNEGTELEFKYQAASITDRALWAQHYIKLQAELQGKDFGVFMIGDAGNPYLRIKLLPSRKVVAE